MINSTERVPPTRRKDIAGLFAVIISIATSTLALAQQLYGIFGFGIALAAIVALSFIVWTLRGATPIIGAPAAYKYPRWIRTTAGFTGLAAFLCLLFEFALLAGFHFYRPIINDVRPTVVEANGVCSIIGNHFGNDSNRIRVYFGLTPIEHVIGVNEKKIELIVPETASSGPVRIFRRNPIAHWLPDLSSSLPLQTIQRSTRSVVFIEEPPKLHSNELEIPFSLLNTAPDIDVTVTDISLQLLVSEPKGSYYFTNRINLGSFTVVIGSQQKKQLEEELTPLLPSGVVLKLRSGESDSLRFALRRPNGSEDVRIVFVLVCRYFDSAGHSYVKYGTRLYFIGSYLAGFEIESTKLFDEQEVKQLQAKYPNKFHLLDGYK